MQQYSLATRKPSSGLNIASIFTLSLWRVGKTWWLLLITTLGLIAAEIVTCAFPLYAQITTNQGIHSMLNSSYSSAEIETTLLSGELSTAYYHRMQGLYNQTIQSHLKTYLQPDVRNIISIQDAFGLAPATLKGSYHLSLTGTSLAQTTGQLHLVQGRFPQASSKIPEIMMTPETAKSWRLHVGSTLNIGINYLGSVNEVIYGEGSYQIFQSASSSMKVKVVGLFTVPADKLDYWHQSDFEPVSAPNRASRGIDVYFKFLMADSSLLTFIHNITTKQATGSIVTQGAPYEIDWYYHLNTDAIKAGQLSDLGQKLSDTQAAFTRTYLGVHSDYNPQAYRDFYIQGNLISLPGVENPVQQFQNRVAVASTPVEIITPQIIIILLFFVSMMFDLLIERQAEAIAVLRSRGASSGQIFSAFWLQGIFLSIIALLAGPILAIYTVAYFVQNTLGINQLATRQQLMQDPHQVMMLLAPYALSIALVAILTLGLTLLRAARMDVLSIRRQVARNTKRSFWQRLHLDIIFGVLALAGYGASSYLTGDNTVLDARGQTLLATPLALIAPLFLVVGCLLFFLRIFPLLLRLVAAISSLGRGATSMLAFSQMARAPRQSVRMIALLACAITLAIFTLSFQATQVQHNTSIAAYEAGADFSGPVVNSSSSPLDQKPTEIKYQHIPGVIVASIGFADQGTTEGQNVVPMQVRAVNADTFANVATWRVQDSTLPLNQLMAQLAAQRASASKNNVVPVYVDELTWERLHLQIGSTFTVNLGDLPYQDLPCQVIGKIVHIPTINDSTAPALAGGTPNSGGVLLDYQSYASVYAHKSKLFSTSSTSLPINYFWLKTSDDAAQLKGIRHTLDNWGNIQNPYYDRRQILSELNSDPLNQNLLGILQLGLISTLLLAVLGNLLASLLSARSRLTNFIVLRAIGTTPAQAMRVVTWEQGLTYISALLLGILLGAILVVTIIPHLIFSNTPANGILSRLSSSEFYALQHVISTTTVIPSSLGIIIVVLAATCTCALALMVRAIAHPAMGKVLRLNED